MKRILFVCTGNTCRSPMAEAIMRDRAARRSLDIEVRSAGVSTVDGMAVSANAAETLRRKQIAHNGTSRVLAESAVQWADLILTMTASHKRSLLGRFPSAMEKTHTLLEYASLDEQTAAKLAELERLYTEWQMKQALGQEVTDADRTRMIELERQIPGFDIDDPFGGPLHVYESCAAQIEEAVEKLLDRLAKDGHS
ncbi:low molecular weight protein arginine phosphatase [Paenibacillus sp. PR3]|uniref:Low molecular weight protein arginine phosphatase n=1 Tax=Paenibacillus terricola TaxID=2763503 RepID=A0ABR8N0L7_9BACL|nr:low molecular weight protein arginine phosphatase [Paenibacillus terricola]MBD3920745.1 low molecular weight protein arginine phosphatase [Paenibacillus terricola]